MNVMMAILLLPFLALAVGDALGPEVVHAVENAGNGGDVGDMAHGKSGFKEVSIRPPNRVGGFYSNDVRGERCPDSVWQ